MPLAHLALAVLVVAIWGTNFVVIHFGLDQFPPFTFAALRFLFAALPLLWFFPLPRIGLRPLVAHGLLNGVGQFGLMLYAIAGHISPGLASLLIQTQAFFTIGLAAWLTGERVTAGNLAALSLCAAGVALIAGHVGGGADALGILLVLGAALSWAGCNLIVKRAGAIDMLGLVVWSSLVSAIPLFAIAMLLEGPAAMAGSVASASAGAWASVLWQSFGNAVFGYAAWNWLLVRHSAALVTPMGLLVPIFGMSASAWLLTEPMPGWKIWAALLVLTGLAANLLAARWRARRETPELCQTGH